MKSIQARNVTARLKWPVRYNGRDLETGHTVQREAIVGVWIDTEQLKKLALRAKDNRSKKAKDGALNVELHYITEVKG